jgi:hypothetical protein
MTIEIPIITTLKDKGLKEAQKGLNSLSKAAKTLGIAYGAFEAIKFSKNAVKAFADDQKAAGSLSKTLENLGQSYAIISTAGFIQKLQNTTGILDDELRPAFSQLVNSTLDAKKAQDLLTVALDVSAGSTKDLQTVTTALSKAAIGEKGAIAKLNVGLNSAQLKTMSLADITDYLSKKYDGQASLAAESFAGKLAILQAHASDASETIGGALLNALDNTFGDPEKYGSGIDSLASKISNLIDKSSRFLEVTKGLFQFKLKLDSPSVANYKLNFDKPYDPMSANFPYEKLRAQEKKAQADAKKALAAQLAATKKQTAETKKQAALKKAQGILDVEKAGIIAALQGKISDDERLRLQLLLAINTENSSEATRLSAELAKSQLLTTGLAKVIAELPPALNPLKDYPTYVDKAVTDIKRIQDALDKLKAPKLVIDVSTSGGLLGATGSAQTPLAPSTSGLAGLGLGGDQGAVARALEQTSIASVSNSQLSGYQDYRAGERNTNVNVTVQGNVISNKDLADTIRMQLLDSSASGSFTMSNRATRGD